MLTYLVLGVTYAFAAAVQPGPFQTYLISRTLTDGLRRAIPGAFAPLLSDPPIIVLVLLVLRLMPPRLVLVLQGVGGLFLLYLAVGAYKTWREFDPEGPIQVASGRQTLLKAALVNLLNPAPYLGWSLVMGPLLRQGWQAAPRNGIALLAGFYSMLIFGTIAILGVFAAARRIGPRLTRALVGISAFALAGFGFYELWSGIATLLKG
jgi:threonine/homoserine/homoserine lactone efflux protein